MQPVFELKIGVKLALVFVLDFSARLLPCVKSWRKGESAISRLLRNGAAAGA